MFLNTLSHSLDMMKQGGIDAGMQRQETEDALILTINIPKTKKQQPVTVYNLLGQPVKSPRQGIYIVNNKAVVIR